MQTPSTSQECIRFGVSGRLSGVLEYPTIDAPVCAILLLSPHPNFAGDMENNVIRALAGRLSQQAITLRFDYRGVGQSRIDLPNGLSTFDYWDRIEQSRDYTDPIADVCDAAAELWGVADRLPMIAVGYSFGAVTGTRAALADPRFIAMAGIAPPLTRIGFEFLAQCPKPCLMLSGDDDFVYDAHAAARLITAAGSALRFERLKGMDHFFRDQEQRLADQVARFVGGQIKDTAHGFARTVQAAD